MRYSFEFLQRVIMNIKPDQCSARIHGLRNKLLRLHLYRWALCVYITVLVRACLRHINVQHSSCIKILMSHLSSSDICLIVQSHTTSVCLSLSLSFYSSTFSFSHFCLSMIPLLPHNYWWEPKYDIAEQYQHCNIVGMWEPRCESHILVKSALLNLIFELTQR